MSFLGELLYEAVFELATYAAGKWTVLLLLPQLHIEPLVKQKSMPAWRWRGFTYTKDNRRYLYTEAVQLIGLAVLVLLGIGIVAMIRHVVRG